MKKTIDREKMFWIIFCMVALAIFEAAIYFSTGQFYVCGRFGDCGPITTKGFVVGLILTTIFILLVRFVNKEQKIQRKKQLQLIGNSNHSQLKQILLALAPIIVIVIMVIAASFFFRN